MNRVWRGIRSLKFAVPLLSLLILVVAGCAKPPQTDIDSAKQSIDQAAAVKDYAPQQYQAANEAWNTLQTELQAQDSKFALFRSYKNAKEMAAAAKAAGDKALSDGNAAKEKAKNDCTQMMTDAQTALDDAKALLEKAPKGKGEKEAIEALKAELTAAETSLADANSAFQAGNYLQAKAKLQSVMNSANEVKTQVQAAIDAKMGRK
jgi:membrane-associated HD superfamily phosphohydrolase